MPHSFVKGARYANSVATSSSSDASTQYHNIKSKINKLMTLLEKGAHSSDDNMITAPTTIENVTMTDQESMDPAMSYNMIGGINYCSFPAHFVCASGIKLSVVSLLIQELQIMLFVHLIYFLLMFLVLIHLFSYLTMLECK